MMNQFEKSRPPKMRPTIGMIRSFTSESTILPNAAPMMTPTARSITFPLTANSRNSPIIDMPVSPCDSSRWNGAASDRLLAAFARPDAHDLIDVGHEDLAVANLAGTRRLDDRLDRAIDGSVADDQRDFHLRQEIDDVFGAAIKLGVAALTPEAFDFGDGEPRHADLGERFAHFVEFERLDDGFDLFHGGRHG